MKWNYDEEVKMREGTNSFVVGLGLNLFELFTFVFFLGGFFFEIFLLIRTFRFRRSGSPSSSALHSLEDLEESDLESVPLNESELLSEDSE